MKKIFYITIAVVLFGAVSCSTNETDEKNVENSIEKEFDTDRFLKELAEIETKLNVDLPQKNDMQKAVTYFQDYATHFPDDNKSGDYLLKASDLAKALEQYEKSVTILDRIIEEYPTYEKIESVYYNRASHTDFEIRDTALARVYYVEFMEKFPKSDFIDDAQARLDQNFLSMEELIEMWTKNPPIEQ